MRTRCYNLHLTDRQLAEIVYRVLVAPLREKFTPQEFDGLAQLMQRVSAQENRVQNSRAKQFTTAYAFVWSSDLDEENEERQSQEQKPSASINMVFMSPKESSLLDENGVDENAAKMALDLQQLKS